MNKEEEQYKSMIENLKSKDEKYLPVSGTMAKDTIIYYLTVLKDKHDLHSKELKRLLRLE